MITMAEKYRTGRALRPFSFIGVVTYTIAAHTADLAKGLMCVLADKVATGSVFLLIICHQFCLQTMVYLWMWK
ncbi:hypothetical protein [Aliamphritea spongicola]|nr:hypothetical protein [Aliamphritea spongicola]